MPSKRKTAASEKTDAPTPEHVPDLDLEPVTSTAVPILPHNTRGLPLTNNRGEPLDPALRGPSYWELRRAQWTTPDPAHPPKERQISPGVAKLQRELVDFEMCYDNDYFTKNVQGLISQLLSSGRLKVPMPLPIFLRILFSQWIRDDTFPRHMRPAPSPPPENTPSGSALPHTNHKNSVQRGGSHPDPYA